ncbi:hypothetical protein J6590_053329 [Homalodisca vitripennis]|nr:hypothetical protein J6590_053329 [Homalodisca vitripennis]
MNAEVGHCVATDELVSVRIFQDGEYGGLAPGNWGTTFVFEGTPISSYSNLPSVVRSVLGFSQERWLALRTPIHPSGQTTSPKKDIADLEFLRRNFDDTDQDEGEHLKKIEEMSAVCQTNYRVLTECRSTRRRWDREGVVNQNLLVEQGRKEGGCRQEYGHDATLTYAHPHNTSCHWPGQQDIDI